MLSEEEKYKIALFMIIRNSKVLTAGIKLNKSMEEINQMSYETMQEIIDNIQDTVEIQKIIKPIYNFKAKN